MARLGDLVDVSPQFSHMEELIDLWAGDGGRVRLVTVSVRGRPGRRVAGGWI